ncbi:hypothetical protein ROTAS13_04731 [Roseomonas sp. TAS13]|nr:hypothetical protein ROTAS13_04731 [Roseomonas sp. TAS13]
MVAQRLLHRLDAPEMYGQEAPGATGEAGLGEVGPGRTDQRPGAQLHAAEIHVPGGRGPHPRSRPDGKVRPPGAPRQWQQQHPHAVRCLGRDQRPFHQPGPGAPDLAPAEPAHVLLQHQPASRHLGGPDPEEAACPGIRRGFLHLFRRTVGGNEAQRVHMPFEEPSQRQAGPADPAQRQHQRPGAPGFGTPAQPAQCARQRRHQQPGRAEGRHLLHGQAAFPVQPRGPLLHSRQKGVQPFQHLRRGGWRRRHGGEGGVGGVREGVVIHAAASTGQAGPGCPPGG